jgi:hypothetical protein
MNLTRRGFLGAAATAAMSLAGCSLDGIERPDIKAEDKPQNNSLQALIELEIRKLDPWAAEFVRQDYTQEKAPGQVNLRTYDPNEMRTRRIGVLFSYYDPGKSVLQLPTASNFLTKELNLIISNELGSAFFSDLWKKGLLKSPEYEGLPKDRIAEYCRARMDSKEFQQLRAAEEKAIRIEEFLRSAELAAEQYRQALTRAQKLAVIYLKLNKDQNVADVLNRNSIRDTVDPFLKRYEELLKLTDEVVGWNANIKSRIRKGLSFEECDRGISEVQAYVQKLSQYLSFPTDSKAGAETVLKECAKYLDGRLGNLANEAKDFHDDGSDKSKLARTELETKIASANVSRLDVEVGYRTVQSGILEVEREMQAQHTKASQLNLARYIQLKRDALSDVSKNPSEIIARMLSSLYNLYYGEATMNNFQLTEDDLAFIGGFYYKGEQIFKKGIEKYRLGLRLLAGRMGAQEIKSMLEFATHVVYKGRAYTFEPADFRIRGNIPDVSGGLKADFRGLRVSEEK